MKLYNIKTNIIILITLVLVEMIGVSYIVIWREGFWSAVEHKNLHSFIYLTIIFTVIALTLCIVSGIESFIMSKIALEWRRRLTRKCLKLKLDHIEGYQQRVQDDTQTYPDLFIMLWKSYIYNGIMSLFFICVIIKQVGVMYIIFPIFYLAISTVCSRWIANPLTKLYYQNQVKEASFRQKLTRKLYGIVHRNNHNVFVKTKHIQYFQYFYGQIGVIFPYIVLANFYFTGGISFGILMQVAATISHLVDAGGVLINNYGVINKYKSCKKRLKEIKVI
jgi:vitamin B12/bleomycin/antimicrobial peptide transport system ATP-binding/permease protein